MGAVVARLGVGGETAYVNSVGNHVDILFIGVGTYGKARTGVLIHEMREIAYAVGAVWVKEVQMARVYPFIDNAEYYTFALIWEARLFGVG